MLTITVLVELPPKATLEEAARAMWNFALENACDVATFIRGIGDESIKFSVRFSDSTPGEAVERYCKRHHGTVEHSHNI